MIIVLAEAGGTRLLGKAREMADSIGLRVLALRSQDSRSSAQDMISLGADEVISVNAQSVGDWSRVLAYLIRNEKSTKFVLAASNSIGEAILGSTYAMAEEQVGSFAVGVDALDQEGASVVLPSASCVLRYPASRDKVSMWSARPSSLAEPFQDTSRYGKTRDLEMPVDQYDVRSPQIKGSTLIQDSLRFTLLLGPDYFGNLESKQKQKLESLAKKYSGSLLEMRGNVQVVFGPCLAIEVPSSERELPDFYSDLISLNSKPSPITKIARLGIVSAAIEQVVDGLLNAN